MNKDQMKGKLENLKGRVKEALGAASGDKQTQGQGFVERVKGAVEKKYGDAKDAISRHDKQDVDEETRRRIEREESEDAGDDDPIR
jgi:uncharacterized protein YjbJ (UPF0337 family)